MVISLQSENWKVLGSNPASTARRKCEKGDKETPPLLREKTKMDEKCQRKAEAAL